MLLQNLKVKTSIIGSMVNALDLAAPQVDLVQAFERDYDDGSAADQAQIFWSDERTLAGSAAESLDLAGVLSHPLGGTITFTAIKEIIVIGDDGNAVNIRVGATVTNAFQGPFGAAAVGCLVEPGGLLHLATRTAAGWAVTGGTGDLLRIENLGGSSVTYKIIIIGEGTVA